MAQQAIVGLTGSVSLPDSLVPWVGSFTVSTGAALLDTSHYGGHGWVTRVAGIKDLGGTAVCFMTKGVSGSSPFGASTTGGSMTLTWDVGCSITFNAIIGQTTIVGEYAGLNIVTFAWSKHDDADITPSWQTT